MVLNIFRTTFFCCFIAFLIDSISSLTQRPRFVSTSPVGSALRLRLRNAQDHQNHRLFACPFVPIHPRTIDDSTQKLTVIGRNQLLLLPLKVTISFSCHLSSLPGTPVTHCITSIYRHFRLFGTVIANVAGRDYLPELSHIISAAGVA